MDGDLRVVPPSGAGGCASARWRTNAPRGAASSWYTSRVAELAVAEAYRAPHERTHGIASSPRIGIWCSPR